MKQGLFEYVNLKKMDLKTKDGKPYTRYVVVSDVKGETYKVYEKLKKLGFQFNRYDKYWYVYPQNLTHEILDGLKQINKELEAEGGQTENIEDFIASLDELKAEVRKSSMPTMVKSNLDALIDQFIEDIANAADARAADAEIQKYIDFQQKFHDYSFRNSLLIFLQDPNATKVAGEKRWERAFNRKVIDLNKPIWIWCGNQMYINDKTGKESSYTLDQQKKDNAYIKAVRAGDEPYDQDKMDAIKARNNIVRVKFEPCIVYDVANTKGDPLPEEPEWMGVNDNREDAIALFNIAKKAIEEDGIKVTQSSTFGSEGGYSTGGHINITQGIVGSVAASTIFHEWAHELLHQKTGRFYEKYTKYMEEMVKKRLLSPTSIRAIKEIQVETVSAVMCRYYGLTTQYHPTYIALWEKQGEIKSKELIKENIITIRDISNYMIKKIDVHRDEFDKVRAKMQQEPQQKA